MVGYNQPLALPQGSVRAILALSTIGAGFYGLIMGVLQFEQFVTMTAIVYAFYFSSKKASEECEEGE